MNEHQNNNHMVYRARAACHIGGLRKPGDVFRWERFEPCPRHLEELDPVETAPAEASNSVETAPAKEAPGPTSIDIEALAPMRADKAQAVTARRGHGK